MKLHRQTPFHEIRLNGEAPVLLMEQSAVAGLKGKEMHTHPEGQFYFATFGLIVVETAMGRVVMPPGRLGWIPPMMAHGASVMGRSVPRHEGESPGFTLYLLPELCEQFPVEPAVMSLSGLLHELLKRMKQWEPFAPLDRAQKRLLDVFIDEIHCAPPEPLRLKMPDDTMLVRMATTMIKDPSDNTSLAEWSERIGLSSRTITRHFREQTGMSVAEWRQVARLQKSLELLGAGESVTEVSLSLGYDSVSSFIALFRRVIGTTPAKFSSQMRSE